VRHIGGSEGERRLRAPRRDVGGLEIFFLLHLGRGTLTKDDRLGVAPSGVAAVKALKVCVGVGNIEADLENTPQPLPGVPNVKGFRVARARVPHEGPKGIECRGSTREIKRVTKNGDRRLDTPKKHTARQRATPILPRFSVVTQHTTACVVWVWESL
jgi:hypothetical protein